MKTENRNKNTVNIDLLDSSGIVKLINDEDLKIAFAVQNSLPQIAQGVDIISKNFLEGGRLFYFGAGTSGRLGILDASECPPTFSTNPEMVQGIIAGGDKAIKSAVEGAEDSIELAQKDFSALNTDKNDTITAISASGNAKYVIEVLKLAQQSQLKTIAITSNPEAKMLEFADCKIVVETGEEALTGSTRMKAGTAQKMVLNMLSTGAMIKIGKTYENLMIDVNPSNEKLKKRAVQIVADISGCEKTDAEKELSKNGCKIKHAILKIRYNLDFTQADELLVKNDGILRKVFQTLSTSL